MLDDCAIRLSEFSNANDIALLILHHNYFPVAGGRVEDHLVDDAASGCDLIKVNLELNILLLVVAHELQLDVEGARALLLRQCDLVGLLRLHSRWERLPDTVFS